LAQYNHGSFKLVHWFFNCTWPNLNSDLYHCKAVDVSDPFFQGVNVLIRSSRLISTIPKCKMRMLTYNGEVCINRVLERIGSVVGSDYVWWCVWLLSHLFWVITVVLFWHLLTKICLIHSKKENCAILYLSSRERWYNNIASMVFLR
jgi:hypothetical protein